ncbi:MAG: Serine phosphatase RsbU, regulator of sigma subunit, partial [uncultured Acidimicrobiales bacterium]
GRGGADLDLQVGGAVGRSRPYEGGREQPDSRPGRLGGAGGDGAAHQRPAARRGPWHPARDGDRGRRAHRGAGPGAPQPGGRCRLGDVHDRERAAPGGRAELDLGRHARPGRQGGLGRAGSWPDPRARLDRSARPLVRRRRGLRKRGGRPLSRRSRAGAHRPAATGEVPRRQPGARVQAGVVHRGGGREHAEPVGSPGRADRHGRPPLRGGAGGHQAPSRRRARRRLQPHPARAPPFSRGGGGGRGVPGRAGRGRR